MNVGVVSSQLLFRKALSTLLTQSNRFSSVTEHSTNLDFICLIDKSQPVVLVVHTPDLSVGIDLVREIRDQLPEARVILLSEELDDEMCVQALETGAWGCLSTTENPQVLLKAVTKVGEGERWFAHRVTSIIIGRHIAGQQLETRVAGNLTPREWEVLSLLAKGYADKEIAGRLFISKETARSHVKSIYKKLQVSTRHAAAVHYFRHVRQQSRSSKPLEIMAFPNSA